MATKHIHINFSEILEIAQRGVRRASIFMGFGVNAALDPSFKSYQLTHITQLQFIPDNVSDEKLRHFKQEFQIWIEAAGLRELTESFALFLDAVHQACLFIQTVQSKAAMGNREQKDASFRRKGSPKKLKLLAQQFDVMADHPDFLNSIVRARNCLTHRMGVVGTDDLYGEGELIVRWIGMDVYAVSPTGVRTDLFNIPEGGVILPDAGKVMLGFVERSRAFKLGDKLALSTRELAEICFYVQREAGKITGAATAFAKRMGVRDNNGSEITANA